MKQECYVSENFRFKFQVIMGAVRGFLQNISCKTSKKIVVQMLAWFNQSFTRILIETAMGRKISKDEEILLDDGKWIKMRNVFKYPFFQRAIEKFGPSKTFSLIIGALGRFDDFLSRCEENVVVLAHTHEWKEQQIEGTKSGRTYYVNTGTWIDKHEFSYAYIVPPTRAKAGLVEVRRNFLSSDED